MQLTPLCLIVYHGIMWCLLILCATDIIILDHVKAQIKLPPHLHEFLIYFIKGL